MKRGIPMYVRILLCLVGNLAVAAILLGWVLKSYYGLGKDDLISNTIEGRMEGMTRLLIPALNGAEQSEWNEILVQTEKSNGVELAIVSPDSLRHYAGSKREIPEEISTWMQKKFVKPEMPRERQSRPRGERPGLGPPSGPHDRSPEGDFLDMLLDDEREHPRGRGLKPKTKSTGTLKVERIGSFGSPPTELAVVHFWIDSRENEPGDLMLIVWKTASGSQVFFSWNPLFYCLLGLLIITGFIWVPFFYRITRRLRILTRGAESISEGNFEIDVASGRSDELGRLSRSVQSMAMRLDDYVAGQKRFLGDIAHELCSPLVRIRMGLGVLEHQMEEEEVAKLSNISDEVEELSQLVNELLDFSKASMKPDALELEDVDVLELCQHTTSREGGDDFIQISAPEGLIIKSRADLLRRAVGNLLRNSLRYASGGGKIALNASKLNDQVIITVEDNGPGLPDAWLEKVFEPFSRPDDARTREDGGSGLGMAIAKTCVTSLGGEIHCENRASGGLRVVISLPLSD